MDSSKASAGNGKSPAEIKVFENTEFGSVRTAVIDGEPFFVRKDVASILGYTNPLKAVRDHVDEDDKGVNESFTPEGGTQKTIFINESGLYSLILSSKLPAAKKFKHWVTSEVLPAIRKTGSYTAPAPKSDRELSIEEARILESLIPLCPVDTYRQILASHIARKVTGEFILPLPKAERKSYSAGQVGEMLGVSGNSIGRTWAYDHRRHKAASLFFKEL